MQPNIFFLESRIPQVILTRAYKCYYLQWGLNSNLTKYLWVALQVICSLQKKFMNVSAYIWDYSDLRKNQWVVYKLYTLIGEEASVCK